MISENVSIQNKLKYLLMIVGFGLALSIAVHFGFRFNHYNTYPYSTFLGLESLRFSDFTDVCHRVTVSRPYDFWTLYFPATFPIFRFYCSVWGQSSNTNFPVYFFFIVNTGFMWILVRRFFLNKATAWMAFLLFLVSYPFLYVIDRGNIEILIVNLVFAAFVWEKKNFLSAFFLAFSAGVKAVPGIFLIYFGKNFKGSVLPFCFLIIVFTLFGLSVLDGDPMIHLRGLLKQHSIFNSEWGGTLLGFCRSTSFYGGMVILFKVVGFSGQSPWVVANFIYFLVIIFILRILLRLYFFGKISSPELILVLAICYVALPRVSSDYKGIMLFLPLPLS